MLMGESLQFRTTERARLRLYLYKIKTNQVYNIFCILVSIVLKFVPRNRPKLEGFPHEPDAPSAPHLHLQPHELDPHYIYSPIRTTTTSFERLLATALPGPAPFAEM